MVSIDFGGDVDDETAIPIISTTSDERTDKGDKTTKGCLTAQRTASLSLFLLYCANCHSITGGRT